MTPEPGCDCLDCMNDPLDPQAHNTRWEHLNLIDRVTETLNAKLEGNNRLPERGMFNCADIQQLLTMVNP